MLKNLKVFIPLILFAAIAFFLWRGLSLNPSRVPSPFINKPVPVFSARNLHRPNFFITEKEFKGHVSLLNVFATWCMSCQAEHPVLMDIQRLGRVKIYGIDFKDERQKVLAWLANHGDPYEKVLHDPQGRLGINLGVYGTPETFVIDQQGIIRYKVIGPISPRTWHTKLQPLIQRLQKADKPA